VTNANQHQGAAESLVMPGRSTLRKTEILHGYRSFTTVIASGKTLVVRPVRLFYVVEKTSSPGVLIGFAVSRSIRGSVRRNRIKRLLRESYRLQKQPLMHALQNYGSAVSSVLMYVGPNPEKASLLRLDDVRTQVGELLERLANSLMENV
jgi:ribonuclease P protein component